MATESKLPSYGIKPQFIVDTESQRNTDWEEGTTVWCKDTEFMYILVAGSFKPIINSDSFVIENRTSDPSTPATGQIWYRTNL